MVVATVVVINSMIGGFSCVDLLWLAPSIVRLQVSDNGQLSEITSFDYNSAE